MTVDGDAAEGPWRVAAQFRLAVLAEVGDLGAAAAAARLGATLMRAGLPLAEARAVPPGGLHPFLQRSVATGIDALVIEARTLIDPGSVAELRRIADRDPMIIAVVPRFAVAAERPMADADPELSYILSPDARCTYVKASALAISDPMQGEGDDLVGPLLALNRVGFRVAVAARALVLHPDGTMPATAALVPPDWRPALARYQGSAPYLADALMAGLRPGPDGRRAIAFDLSHASQRHSGTTWLARALVRRAAVRWADIALHVVASEATFAFHFGDLGDAVTRADPADPRVFAALVRVGQPFLWGEIDAAARRAPVLVLSLLDTIGLDCLQHAPDELDALWRFCLAEADALVFNTAFTKRQFARRFAMRPDMPAVISLHSLDLADYRLGAVPDAPEAGAILVVGNAMPHKRLPETAALLAGAGLRRPVIVLGLPPGALAGVEAISSGGVTPERMVELYAAARVLVYPSVYEGFGFPILDALAHRRPILVRDLPPYAEIAAGLPERVNIHRFSDDADLLRRLVDPPAWIDATCEGPVRAWDDATDDLRAAIDTALAAANPTRLVRRIDALRGRMSYMRARSFGGDGDGNDDLDRVAGLAGRLVRNAVLWIGRLIPGVRRPIGAARRLLKRRPG